MLANVKIEQDKKNKHIHRVFVDGKKVDRVRTIDFCVDVDSAPEVNVEIVGGIDFEGMADIHFDYSPYTVEEACKILRDELLKHGDFYKAFVASAKSGILDCPKGSKPHEMAEFIVKRLIGEE